MNHPDCSCCVSAPCERSPDIFENCDIFRLAPGKQAVPMQEWRPDFSKSTSDDIRRLTEADARHGLPDCYQDFERLVDSAWMPLRYGRINLNQDIFKEE